MKTGPRRDLLGPEIKLGTYLARHLSAGFEPGGMLCSESMRDDLRYLARLRKLALLQFPGGDWVICSLHSEIRLDTILMAQRRSRLRGEPIYDWRSSPGYWVVARIIVSDTPDHIVTRIAQRNAARLGIDIHPDDLE